MNTVLAVALLAVGAALLLSRLSWQRRVERQQGEMMEALRQTGEFDAGPEDILPKAPSPVIGLAVAGIALVGGFLLPPPWGLVLSLLIATAIFVVWQARR